MHTTCLFLNNTALYCSDMQLNLHSYTFGNGWEWVDAVSLARKVWAESARVLQTRETLLRAQIPNKSPLLDQCESAKDPCHGYGPGSKLSCRWTLQSCICFETICPFNTRQPQILCEGKIQGHWDFSISIACRDFIADFQGGDAQFSRIPLGHTCIPILNGLLMIIHPE